MGRDQGLTNAPRDNRCLERVALDWGVAGPDREDIGVFMDVSERLVSASLLHAGLSAPGHDGDLAKLAPFE